MAKKHPETKGPMTRFLEEYRDLLEMRVRLTWGSKPWKMKIPIPKDVLKNVKLRWAASPALYERVLHTPPNRYEKKS